MEIKSHNQEKKCKCKYIYAFKVLNIFIILSRITWADPYGSPPDALLPPWAKYKAAEEPPNKPGGVEKTIQQIASLCQKNPRPPGNGSTKTPNVLLPLPWLQGLGQQMKKEGHRTAQCGPSARKHEPPPRALLCTLHPSHSVPQFPPLSSQRVPTGDYSAKRAISFGMRQNTKSCQVKFGRSLRVSAHRTWNPVSAFLGDVDLSFSRLML